MSTNINECRLIDIPKIHNDLGSLSVIEGKTLPFEIKRVFHLYKVQNVVNGQAWKNQQTFLVALNGSFETVLRDTINEHQVTLSKPNQGLFVPEGIWIEIKKLSPGSVILMVASTAFDANDQLADWENFRSFKNSIS